MLVGEGLPDGKLFLGDSTRSQAPVVVLVDPIDGPRGLMYQKRSAWILTGVVSTPTTVSSPSCVPSSTRYMRHAASPQ